MKLDKNNKYISNPRQITQKQMAFLDEHIKEFGDLSGVVYCTKQKSFVGGNMRSEIMDGAEIEIVERFEKPTKNKTVAHGFINFGGEKFAYREVAFNKSEFKKACVVANNDGGSFDYDILFGSGEWQDEDLASWGVILPDFDTAKAPEDFAEYDETIETEHECPKCGYQWSGKKA